MPSDPAALTPEQIAAEEAARRQAEEEAAKQAGTSNAADVVQGTGDLAGAALDGTLEAVVEGASAVAEGAANLVGGLLGALFDA